MKKFIALIFLLLFSFVFAQVGEEARTKIDSTLDFGLDDLSNETEKILIYHSDITVNKDASLRVIETITVNAKGENIKRGIFRTLPLRREINGKNQKVRYTDISVKKNGVKEPFSESYENIDLKIYIGNEDVFLTPGVYTYELSYTTKNQVGFFSTYDELYWNVNGTNWDFVADEVSATVHLPNGSKIIQNACYTGSAGSKEKNCISNIISDTEISWKTKKLQRQENLTIAVGFNKGIVFPPPPPTFLEKYGVLIFLTVVFLLVVLYGYYSWKKYGVDPPKPVVYPQFNIPSDFSPASLGYVKFEGYHSNFLTASLVNLAIKGYIQIKEKSKTNILGIFNSTKYEIIKLKEADESLPNEEKSLMSSLLGTEDSVLLDGEYNSKVEQAVSSFKSNLKYQHDKFLNEGNNLKHLLWPSLIILLAYVVGLVISQMIDNDIISLIIGVLFLGFMTVLYLILIFAVKNFKASGCLIVLGIYFMISFFLAFAFFSAVVDFSFSFKCCFFFLIFSFGLLLFMKYIIKRPSEEKLRKQSLIEGFKMYMNAAENEQLKFHNSPQMTPDIFEKLLPFAMVLGVDDIWGQKFQSVMANSASAPQYHNTWYVGSSAINFSSFGSSLNSSLTQSLQSTSTQPSSSSSSGGSSGGGFSGGGGGGGGGGGW